MFCQTFNSMSLSYFQLFNGLNLACLPCYFCVHFSSHLPSLQYFHKCVFIVNRGETPYQISFNIFSPASVSSAFTVSFPPLLDKRISLHVSKTLTFRFTLLELFSSVLLFCFYLDLTLRSQWLLEGMRGDRVTDTP